MPVSPTTPVTPGMLSGEQTSPGRPHPLRPVGTLCVAMLLLTGYVSYLAIGKWDMPIAGLLTEPYGRITNYGWPTWEGYRHRLSFPSSVVAVDGEPLVKGRPGAPLPAEVLLEAAARHAAAGTPIVLTTDGQRQVTLKVERLGWLPWLILFGGYTLLAWIWLLAAGFSYLVRPDSDAVGAFWRWALLNAILLITVFDFHTTRKLVPLFLLAYALLPGAVLELGMRFPDDVTPLLRYPMLIVLPRVLSVVLVVFVLGGWLVGQNYLVLSSVAVGAAICALALQMAVRTVLARGRRRTQLLIGLCLWVPVYLMVGLMLLVMPERGGAYVFVMIVPLTAVGTLGITYALVRYDLWDARVMVRRPVLRPLITAVVALAAGMVAAISFTLLIEQIEARWAQVLVVFAVVTVSVPLHRRFEEWLESTLFPADAFYRPTVEQLSLRFTDLASKAAVVEAVETTVERFLPVERVAFLPLPITSLDRVDDSGEMARTLPPVARLAAAVLASSGGSISYSSQSISAVGMSGSHPGVLAEPPEWRQLRRTARAAGIDGVHSEQAAALCKGEVVYATSSGMGKSWARMLIPSRFRDQVVGLLAVSAKQHAQLYTSEDETLLRTIANQAALALACANAYEQVVTLHRAQQAAFREEKGAALGTVAAEIAHEIRFPINFFRMLLERYGEWIKENRPPEVEDVEIGREEVERLERMAGNLRRIATTRTLSRQKVELRALVDHVRLLLRDRLAGRILDNEVDPLLDVDCDRDAMIQILLNLISNALDASSAPGRVGVQSEILPDGRLRLSVWDVGPGLPSDVGKLFQPWVTSKTSGSGLGLPITRRLVRAHGWEIGAERRAERTCFDVLVLKEEWRMRPPPADEGNFESGPLK